MNLTRREWILLFLVSTLLLAWTSMPTWAGRALENDQYSFVGTFFDAPDYAVHVAMMRAGEEGAWSYELRFTSEPHQHYAIRMFYILLGQTNRLLRLEPELLFQLARWCFGYAALFALFWLMRTVFGDARRTWVAFFLAALGSGLGYLQLMFGWVPGAQTPVDLWLIDAYLLFSLALFPHFAFTLALMCAALEIYLGYLNGAKETWKTWILFPLVLMVQLVNPIAFVLVDIAMGAATAGAWWRDRAIRWGQAGLLGLLAIFQVPLLAYNFWILTTDPVWSQYTLQNETLSPAPIYYLLGFGLFWLPAIIGTIQGLRTREPALLGAAAWVLTAFLLAYAPFAIQRRFLLGITIPLAMLTVRGLEMAARRLRELIPCMRRRVPVLTLLVVLLISMTSLIFTPAYTVYMQSRPREYFYPHALDGAFAWIAQNSGPDDLFLAADETGRLVAQKTGRRVYLGHPMETLHFEEKDREVSAYYKGDLPAAWLASEPIQWVIEGPYERSLSPDFVPEPNLELAFENEAVRIYRVMK